MTQRPRTTPQGAPNGNGTACASSAAPKSQDGSKAAQQAGKAPAPAQTIQLEGDAHTVVREVVAVQSLGLVTDHPVYGYRVWIWDHIQWVRAREREEADIYKAWARAERDAAASLGGELARLKEDVEWAQTAANEADAWARSVQAHCNEAVAEARHSEREACAWAARDQAPDVPDDTPDEYRRGQKRGALDAERAILARRS